MIFDYEPLVMPFGRHRGEHIADLPEDYLEWVLRECRHLDPVLENGIEDELKKRREARQEEAEREAEEAARHRREYWERARRQRPAGDSPPANAVSRDTLATLVKQWYRSLAFKYHHDRGNDQKMMVLLNEARDRLKEALGID